MSSSNFSISSGYFSELLLFPSDFPFPKKKQPPKKFRFWGFGPGLPPPPPPRLPAFSPELYRLFLSGSLLMQDNPLKGFFKWCVTCRGKIPPSDGHSRCLFCLGEGHRSDICSHCQKFSRRTLKDREACLKTVLTEASLRPAAMAESVSSNMQQSVPDRRSAPTALMHSAMQGTLIS